ncbi:MAG: hypothetical protein J6W37_02620 [Bacteroidales bacterium]|nr:hypothetical protein [Bacteroidales bacterium]
MNRLHIANNPTRSIFSIFFALIFFVTSGFSQAMLLNPHGDGDAGGESHWKANGKSSCHYLKPRFAYLCGGDVKNKEGRASDMHSIKRISVDEALEMLNTEGLVKYKTCLSKSYDKDWMDPKVSEDYKEPGYPDIVYAFSVVHEEDVYVFKGLDKDNPIKYTRTCYDVYWYSVAEHPILPPNSDCMNLFQNKDEGTAGNNWNYSNKKYGTVIEDVSGIEDWDFSNAISLMQMFQSCKYLKTIHFKNANFKKVNNVQNMFGDCISLSSDDIISVFAEMNLDITKMQGAENGKHRFSNLDYGLSEVTTKNAITYQIKYKDVNNNNKGSYLTAGVLPIELSLFTATQQGENILFRWETATETNNDFFTIEQSFDGVSFHEVAQIAGAGTSSSSNSYEYSKPVTFSGLMYFRLKQTDYNGEFSYSEVISLMVSANEHIRLYPTIATDYITIEGDYVCVKFCDAQGKINHPERMDGNTYPVSSLPKGMHYAVISMKNGEIITRKFFKN